MPGGGLRVENPLGVRVAGLPARVLTALRFERSFAAAYELVILRERLEAAGARLSDELYEIIGGLREPELKSRLVGLRRRLYQVRRPRPAEWNDQVASAIPGMVSKRVDEWLEWLDEEEQRTAELPRLLSDEESSRRLELRGIAAHPGFRRALSQAAPSLHAELVKWLADEARHPGRQALCRLVKYVARAAAKTSPYSMFTVSGLGSWTGGGPAIRFADKPRVAGVLELEGLLLRDLIGAVSALPRLSRSMPLRVNPSTTVADGVARFVAHPPGEPIVTVTVTPAIAECLRLLDGGTERTVRDLCERLAGRAGTSPERAERFLDGLIGAGLLERRPPVADQSADPLGELADWLDRGGEPGIAALVGRVRAPLRSEVAVADVNGHVARQRTLAGAVADLTTRLGTGPAPPPGQPASKLIFHENAVFTTPVVECAFPRWRTTLEPLDAIRRWLAPFDTGLPLRLALAAYVRERYGSGAEVPIIDLHRAVQQEVHSSDILDPATPAYEVARLLGTRHDRSIAGSPLPRLRQLAEIRRRATRLLVGAPASGGVIRVAPSAIEDATSGWPGWLEPPRSLGCYVQPAGDPHAPSLVLNVAHCGYGRARSRLVHLIREAGGTLPPGEFRGTNGTSTMLAEFGGRFSMTPNVRAASVPYELDYPFTTSDRPAGQRVRTGDLLAVHDPGTDLVRLRSRRSGAAVVPLHLGMMMVALLPPVARLLTEAFGHGWYVDPGGLLAGIGVDRTVTAHPRVEVGGVVLRRAGWTAPTSLVPARVPADTDATYLVRWVRWLREHGIPTRCFVRIPTGAGRWDKSRKPLYVDFAN